MNKKRLIALAKAAIAKHEKAILKLDTDIPVVQMKYHLIADELEICPGLIANYVGSSSYGNVYAIPAHAILEYLVQEKNEHT
jgi:hypothetical protein